MSGMHRQRPGADAIAPATDAPAVALGDGIWLHGGLSNSYLIGTDDGRVIVNTGMGFEGPLHRHAYDAVDPDSLYGDPLDELPGDFDPDAYQDTYGEDPFDPAPARQPDVERAPESARPDLRPTPPVERAPSVPAPSPAPIPDTSSTPASPAPTEESEGGTRAGDGSPEDLRQ